METDFASDLERAYFLEIQELRRRLSGEALKRLSLEQENQTLRELIKRRNMRLGALSAQHQAGMPPLNS
jgi:hypothetical protein